MRSSCTPNSPAPPLGWYQGRTSPNTARLVAEEGGFLYDADSYADDLPYYDRRHGKAQLIVPYSLDANDMKMVALNGFTEGVQFFATSSIRSSSCARKAGG